MKACYGDANDGNSRRTRSSVDRCRTVSSCTTPVRTASGGAGPDLSLPGPVWLASGPSRTCRSARSGRSSGLALRVLSDRDVSPGQPHIVWNFVVFERPIGQHVLLVFVEHVYHPSEVARVGLDVGAQGQDGFGQAFVVSQ